MSAGVDHGVCIDCGRHTPLRLPRRFPHICTECLFPPPALDLESQEDELRARDEDRRQRRVVKPSLIDELSIRAQGAGFYKPFGEKETPQPRRRETGAR